MTETVEISRPELVEKHEIAAKKLFGKEAKRQAAKYEKKGLSSTAKRITELIIAQDTAKNGVYLDSGCGSGKICFELLKNGVKKTIGIDLSEKAIEIAEQLKEKFNFQDRAVFVAGSFLDVEIPTTEPIQGIILHRVLCCHPEAEKILQKVIALNPQEIYITLPTDNRIVRTIHVPIGVLTRTFTKGFQAQLHTHKKIFSILLEHDYTLVLKERKTLWWTYVFRKENKTAV